MIFQFIQTMSQGEKRYFSLQSSIYQTETDAAVKELFRAAAVQSEIDEKKLIARNSDKNFAKRYSGIKHKLKERVLSEMVNHLADSALTFKIRQRLSEAELLLDRGFAADAGKSLEKTILICRDACLFELELEALRIKLRLQSVMDELIIEQISMRKQELFRQMEEADTYDRLIGKLLQLKQEKQHAPEIRSLLRHPMLAERYQPMSLPGEIGKNHFWEHYHYRSGNFDRALHHSELVFKSLTHNDWFATARTTELEASTINLSNGFFIRYSTEKLAEILQQLHKQNFGKTQRNDRNSLQKASVIFMVEMQLAILENKTENILKAEKEILKIAENLSNTNQIRAYKLRYLFIQCCFINGQYRKALRILATAHPFHHFYSEDIRQRQQAYIMIFCYLHTGNYTQLKNFRKSLLAFEADEHIGDDEKILIRFFLEISGSRSRPERKKLSGISRLWLASDNKPETNFRGFHILTLAGLAAYYHGTAYYPEWKKLFLQINNTTVNQSGQKSRKR